MFQHYASNSQHTDYPAAASKTVTMQSLKLQSQQLLQQYKPALQVLRKMASLVGAIAVSMLILMFFKPELAEKFRALSPFAADEKSVEEDTPAPPSLAMLMATPQQMESGQFDDAPLSEGEQKLLGDQKQQRWVTNWLAKRYHVATDATDMLVSAAYLTAKEIKLDPLLILSVMAIESGLNPFAESPVGAQGLMQVMSKVHQDKFEEMGGIKAALNPVANIRVGAQILKNYVTRAGSVEAGLKLYVGAAAFETDAGYGSRVLAEYRRLKDVSNGKRVSIFTPLQTVQAPAVVKPVVINPDDSKTDKARNDARNDVRNDARSDVRNDKAQAAEQKPVGQVAAL